MAQRLLDASGAIAQSGGLPDYLETWCEGDCGSPGWTVHTEECEDDGECKVRGPHSMGYRCRLLWWACGGGHGDGLR